MYLKSTDSYAILAMNTIVLGWRKIIVKIKSTNKYIGFRTVYINDSIQIDESSFCILDTIDSVKESLRCHDVENDMERKDKYNNTDEVDLIMNDEVREIFIPIFKSLLNCSELMEKLKVEEKEEIKQIIN